MSAPNTSTSAPAAAQEETQQQQQQQQPPAQEQQQQQPPSDGVRNTADIEYELRVLKECNAKLENRLKRTEPEAAKYQELQAIAAEKAKQRRIDEFAKTAEIIKGVASDEKTASEYMNWAQKNLVEKNDMVGRRMLTAFASSEEKGKANLAELEKKYATERAEMKAALDAEREARAKLDAEFRMLATSAGKADPLSNSNRRVRVAGEEQQQQQQFQFADDLKNHLAAQQNSQSAQSVDAAKAAGNLSNLPSVSSMQSEFESRFTRVGADGVTIVPGATQFESGSKVLTRDEQGNIKGAAPVLSSEVNSSATETHKNQTFNPASIFGDSAIPVSYSQAPAPGMIAVGASASMRNAYSNGSARNTWTQEEVQMAIEADEAFNNAFHS